MNDNNDNIDKEKFDSEFYGKVDGLKFEDLLRLYAISDVLFKIGVKSNYREALAQKTIDPQMQDRIKQCQSEPINIQVNFVAKFLLGVAINVLNTTKLTQNMENARYVIIAVIALLAIKAAELPSELHLSDIQKSVLLALDSISKDSISIKYKGTNVYGLLVMLNDEAILRINCSNCTNGIKICKRSNEEDCAIVELGEIIVGTGFKKMHEGKRIVLEIQKDPKDFETIKKELSKLINNFSKVKKY